MGVHIAESCTSQVGKWLGPGQWWQLSSHPALFECCWCCADGKKKSGKHCWHAPPPRLRAEGYGVMLLSAIIILLMLERGPTVGVSNTNHANSNESVFSSAIHSFISMTQASIRLMVSVASSWSNMMYSWVPSTYKWAISPCHRTILAIGA